MNTRRRKEAKDRAARIAAGIEDSKKLSETLQQACDSLESARRQMDMAEGELRGQAYVIKERLNWIISEFDKLREEIAAIKTEDAES